MSGGREYSTALRLGIEYAIRLHVRTILEALQKTARERLLSSGAASAFLDRLLRLIGIVTCFLDVLYGSRTVQVASEDALVKRLADILSLCWPFRASRFLTLWESVTAVNDNTSQASC